MRSIRQIEDAMLRISDELEKMDIKKLNAKQRIKFNALKRDVQGGIESLLHFKEGLTHIDTPSKQERAHEALNIHQHHLEHFQSELEQLKID